MSTWYRRVRPGPESFDALWAEFGAGRVEELWMERGGDFVYAAAGALSPDDAAATRHPAAEKLGRQDAARIAPSRELRLREFHELARSGVRAAFRLPFTDVGRVLEELASRGTPRASVSVAAQRGGGANCVVLVEGLTRLEILRHEREWGANAFAGPREATRIARWPRMLPAALAREEGDTLELVTPGSPGSPNHVDAWALHSFQPAFATVRAVVAAPEKASAQPAAPDASFSPIDVPVGLRLPSGRERHRSAHEVAALRELRRERSVLARLATIGSRGRAALEAKAREVLDGTFAGGEFVERALADVESRIATIEERVRDGTPFGSTVAVVFLDVPAARAWAGFALQGASQADLARLRVARVRVARTPGGPPAQLAVFRAEEPDGAPGSIPGWLAAVCRDDKGETYGPVQGWAGDLGLLVPCGLVVAPAWALPAALVARLGRPAPGEVRLLVPPAPHAPAATPVVVTVGAAAFGPVGESLFASAATSAAEPFGEQGRSAIAAAENVVRAWIGEGSDPPRLADPVAARLRAAAARVQAEVDREVREIEEKSRHAAAVSEAAFAEADRQVRSVQADLDAFAAAARAEAAQHRDRVEEARRSLEESARKLGELAAALDARSRDREAEIRASEADVDRALEEAQTGLDVVRDRIEHAVLDQQKFLERRVEADLQRIHAGADRMVEDAPAAWTGLLSSLTADRRGVLRQRLADLLPVVAAGIARAVPPDLLVSEAQRVRESSEAAFLDHLAALLAEAARALAEIPPPHLAGSPDAGPAAAPRPEAHSGEPVQAPAFRRGARDPRDDTGDVL